MRGLAHNIGGFSSLIATLATVSVLLMLGGVLYLMVTGVTPGSTPAIGALASTRNDSGNYTFRVIALTNHEIERDDVSIFITPGNSTISIGELVGDGDRLCQGDTFTISNLHAGTSYTISIRDEATGSVIASIGINAY